MSHFLYLSEEWVESNVLLIFPFRDYRRSFLAAISGLTYCSGAQRLLYNLLAPRGIIGAALEDADIKGSTREYLLQRVALALMWGDEQLEGGLLDEILARDRGDEVVNMLHFVGRIHDNTVPDEIKLRTVSIWRKLDTWAGGEPERKPVLGALISFLPYLDKLDDVTFPLAEKAVANLHSPYEIVSLARQLIRLYDSSPK